MSQSVLQEGIRAGGLLGQTEETIREKRCV